jgi:hypothetical protein
VVPALELLNRQPQAADHGRDVFIQDGVERPAGGEVYQDLKGVAQVLRDRFATLAGAPVHPAASLLRQRRAARAPTIHPAALDAPPVDHRFEAVHPDGVGHFHAANLGTMKSVSTRRRTGKTNGQVACSDRPGNRLPHRGTTGAS